MYILYTYLYAKRERKKTQEKLQNFVMTTC